VTLKGRDSLLAAYQRELMYLRQAGAAFATRYPKIAARLELSADASADPHVERLIESFAFLTARLQEQIDGEFTQFTGSLLEVLYPHLQQPIPPLAIARFEVDAEQGLPLSGFDLGAGTPLFARTDGGSLCRFRTTLPLTLWPIEITEAALEPTDRYPCLDGRTAALAVLRLRLVCRSGSFSQLGLRTLRLFLSAEPQVAFRLYDLLAGSSLGVALLPDGRPEPELLGRGALRPVGLDPEESILPSPAHGHPAYRLLQEYFLFPDKFLFFDVDLPRYAGAQRSVDVLLLLSESPRGLPVGADTFLLGCTPVINLFPKVSEPIRLTQKRLEYPLVPDKRNERTTEVHSIRKVSISADPSSRDEIAPYFSFSHPASGLGHSVSYRARRQPTGRKDLPGTEVFLSFVDLKAHPSTPAAPTIFAHTLCTNRDLAAQMTAGALLQLEKAAPVRRVTCVRKPTEPVDPPLGTSGLWRLVSQLSLNHLSISGSGSGGSEATQALREILRLNCLKLDAAAENQIAGITRVTTRPKTLQIGLDAWRGFCQGLEVSLTVDEALYVGSSALMMSAVLSRFLGMYVAVNSFAQLLLRSEQRQGEWIKWPARTGTQPLL
jgi:type VI secretion system protein ImpG